MSSIALRTLVSKGLCGFASSGFQTLFCRRRIALFLRLISALSVTGLRYAKNCVNKLKLFGTKSGFVRLILRVAIVKLMVLKLD